jgi:biotin operon repressor
MASPSLFGRNNWKTISQLRSIELQIKYNPDGRKIQASIDCFENSSIETEEITLEDENIQEDSKT